MAVNQNVPGVFLYIKEPDALPVLFYTAMKCFSVGPYLMEGNLNAPVLLWLFLFSY